MSKAKNVKVGFIKSVSYDVNKKQMKGIIEAVNDKNNPELPFITSDSMDIEKGKMVKYIKKADSIVPRAVDVEKL